MHWPGYSDDKLGEHHRNRNIPAIVHGQASSTATNRRYTDLVRGSSTVRRALHRGTHSSDNADGPSSFSDMDCQDRAWGDEQQSCDEGDVSTTGTTSSQTTENYGWPVPPYSNRYAPQASFSYAQRSRQARAFPRSATISTSHISVPLTRIPSPEGQINTVSSNHQILLGVRVPFSLVAGATATTRPPPSAGRTPLSQLTYALNPADPDQNRQEETGLESLRKSTDEPISGTPLKTKNVPNSISDQASPNANQSRQISSEDPQLQSLLSITVNKVNEPSSPTRTPRSPRRPKVAFVVPHDQAANKSSRKTQQSDVTFRESTESRDMLVTPKPLAENRGDRHTSPSARFPGWGVITDDEDENDAEKATEAPKHEALPSTITDKRDTPDDCTNTSQEPNVIVQSQQEDTNSCATPKTINVKFKERQFIVPKISTTEDDRQRFREQQEYFRRRESTSITLAKSAAILRQPRKSLAMIFSNLSTNLGFTNSSTRSKTGSVSSASSSDSIRLQPTTGTGSPKTNSGNFIDLSGSKLIRDQRGHSTLIQLGKNQSIDQTLAYMNGDIGHLGRVSILNNALPSNTVRSNTDPISSAMGQPQTRAHLSTDSTNDRSLFVDLLCCTCCTQVDEEADYSNLIENHRLARFITMAAILTILGLILAYIIRSALEAPAQAMQTASHMALSTSPNPANTNPARISFVELSSWTHSITSTHSSSNVGGPAIPTTSDQTLVNRLPTTPSQH